MARSEHPYVLLSCAMSLDGYLDDATDQRLLLSNNEDFDRVDEARAGCDAILVGARTIRKDNPRLLVRSTRRRSARRAAGLPVDPIKVTLTGSGELDPSARFFSTGAEDKIVFAGSTAYARARARLGGIADVIDAGEPVDLTRLLAELGARGVRRLMVEGGGNVYTQFLAADLVDELQIAIAPFFIGAEDAPRFVLPGRFPYGPRNPLRLADTKRLGELVLLRYLRP